MLLKVAAVTLALALPAAAPEGFKDTLTPSQRAWFQRDRIKACCSDADGRKVAWRGNEASGFEIEVDNDWVKVPPQTVIRDQGNPFLEGLAWLYQSWNPVGVRCFIPGGGT